MLNRATFERDLDTRGSSLVENVLSPEYVERAKRELMAAIELEADPGSSRHRDYGMVLLCSLHGGAFLELFDNERLLEPFETILGSGCIVYAYTSSSMPPNGGNYSQRIHVDCPRIIPGYVTNVGATILLDDFEEENGATWFLPGSHTHSEAPDRDEFFAGAQRLIARAGSVWYFNARIWHSGGVNRTDQWRHALTINMCRPWMKQRLDIPRAMGHLELSGASERTLQKLGFRAQPPASYDEYYAAAEERTFRQKAE